MNPDLISGKSEILKLKLSVARESIEKLDGINLSEQHQQKKICSLKKRLYLKTSYIAKYKNGFCSETKKIQ